MTEKQNKRNERHKIMTEKQYVSPRQALTYARNVLLQKKAREDARQREIRAILAKRKDWDGEDGCCDQAG